MSKSLEIRKFRLDFVSAYRNRLLLRIAREDGSAVRGLPIIELPGDALAKILADVAEHDPSMLEEALENRLISKIVDRIRDLHTELHLDD